jgi:hypothetical protein
MISLFGNFEPADERVLVNRNQEKEVIQLSAALVSSIVINDDIAFGSVIEDLEELSYSNLRGVIITLASYTASLVDVAADISHREPQDLWKSCAVGIIGGLEDKP